MSPIQNFGDPKNPIWILMDEPYTNDANDNVVLSGGYGYNFKKTWCLASLSLNDIYIRTNRPTLGASYVKETALSKMLYDIELYRPTFLVPLSDEILNYLVPYTSQAKEKNSTIAKWAGSILQTSYLSYPHYIISSHPPDWVTRNWSYNEIQAYIDFGHVWEEFEYWSKHGTLNPLPKRNLLVQPTFVDLISYLHDCLNLPLVGCDIETLRPKNNTFYKGINCGYPYTIALAKNPLDAISFSLWDYTPDECIKIWIALDKLLNTVPQIGQNYFLFDAHYLKALGFHICLEKCKDTLIRHHILWPSLKHALHFQTRQYTRTPFYKDEGRNFSVKQKDKFMRYNAMDAAITTEIYEAQDQEFSERSHLR
jgi:hypothetical protein